jgi:uncharacterized protein with ACT and thioredoxin-like domain
MISRLFYNDSIQLECFFNNEDNCHLTMSEVGSPETEINLEIEDIHELDELIKELKKIKKLMEIHKAL